MNIAVLKICQDRGGYSRVLWLRPMAYPRPNAVSTRLSTAINPSIVNIWTTSFPGEDSVHKHLYNSSSSEVCTLHLNIKTSEQYVHQAHSESLTVHHTFVQRVTSMEGATISGEKYCLSCYAPFTPDEKGNCVHCGAFLFRDSVKWKPEDLT